MASEVRADSEVAEDVAGIVDENDGGAGGTGASDRPEPDARSESVETRSAGTRSADTHSAETHSAETHSAETSGADVTAEATGSTESTEAGEATGSAKAAADVTEATGATESTEAAEATGSTGAPRRKRRIGIVLLFAALALIIDVASKAIVVAQMQDRGPIHVTGGFLNITLIRNSGAAFSIGEGQTWVFTVIAAAVVFVILRVSRNLRSLPWAIALGLLLGGALGNLSDRLFRSPGVGRGDVVDFLQFPTFPVVHYDFPVFNLADTSIVIGGCLMVLLSFLGMQPDGTRHKDVKSGDDAAG